MTLPGELFASLWRNLEARASDIVSQPFAGRHAKEFAEIVRLLADHPDEEVPKEIESYLAGDAMAFKCDVTSADERAFVVMCALDHVAVHIHPAFPVRLPGLAKPLGGLLAAMRARRTIEGCYSDVPGVGLVAPKGHLMARARRAATSEASGTDLAHQFEHLSILPHLTRSRSLRIVTPEPAKFMTSEDQGDIVGLAPIAEDKDDLTFRVCSRGSSAYLDTIPGNAALADRITQTVTALLDLGAGVIVLPESVSPQGTVEPLVKVLRQRDPGLPGALVLAGTGASQPEGGRRPQNEAVLLSSTGRILGRQCKLHMFNMQAARMDECAIAAADGYAGRPHMEDASAGSELVLFDLHGLGRVMVLICEDLEQQEPGGNAALASLPDWILTPVLDVGQCIGRWAEQRAHEIARKTLSRVVISSPGTLEVRRAKSTNFGAMNPPVNIGVCYDGLAGGRALLVPANGNGSPEHVTVQWDSSTWPLHWTTTKAP